MDLELPVSAARLLYAGIVGDTGRFLYPATSTRTFEIAAYLRSIPFDFTALARQMDTINLKTAKLQGYVYDHLEIDEHGAARVTLTQKLLKKFDLRDSETAAIVELLDASIPYLFGLSLLSRPTVTSVSGCVANAK